MTYENPLKRRLVVEAPPAPVEKPKRTRKKKEVAVVEKPTRKALVRPAFGMAPMEVEIPTVESRFATAFREPTTDNPGLVIDDSGNVYLVNPDGTRTLLSGGGGSTFPTFYQLAEPGSPADGDTWMRPAGGYPDQYAVGAFRWNTDAGWQPIGTVALNDLGQVLGQVTVGPNDGNIQIQKVDPGAAWQSEVFLHSGGLIIGARNGGDTTSFSLTPTSSELVVSGHGQAYAGAGYFTLEQLDGIETTAFTFRQGLAAYNDDDEIAVIINGNNQQVWEVSSSGRLHILPTDAGNISFWLDYADHAKVAMQVGDDSGGVFIGLDRGTGGDGQFTIQTANSTLVQVIQNAGGPGVDVIQLGANGSPQIGFFGTTALQQTVTGDTGGNAALISLISALAATGLIIDGT